jgi:nitrite reductase/ring-hydroxylating ferredoxin subunit/DMSO/TMAO reductase YedYZ heme-binding membrane subunit
MSVAFAAVGWNRQKFLYDGVLLGLLLLGLAGYGITMGILHPNTTFETFVIRFTALSALILLHVILAIGPLARIDPRFTPLLYNRRHLGVTMFLLSLVHGLFSTLQFHAGGDANPFVSVFSAYSQEYWTWMDNPADFKHFPFEIFGFLALFILFVMAATSHDFWLRQLGPSVWKCLHLGVYLAYFLILIHLALGALQSEQNPIYPVLLDLGFVILAALHIVAARQVLRKKLTALQDNLVEVAQVADVAEGRAKTVWVKGTSIALVRKEGKIYALSNVCRHQGGPLGEGQVLYGCLTCPWHGYQYQPHDGCSPPPFKEIVPTYKVEIRETSIFLNPNPLALTTASEGASVTEPGAPVPAEQIYIGWQKKAAPAQALFLQRVVISLAILIPALMVLIAASQNPVEQGGYEFGVERTFTGVVYADPLPMMHVTIPVAGHETIQNLVLVGAGKFAVPTDFLSKATGKQITVSGSLLYWKNMLMLEVNQPNSLKIIADAPEPLKITPLGSVTLTGELVDTKCYFGAMRPAVGKIHRGCAIRCLSGGVPPGLLIRDGSGNGFVVMLAGQQGDHLLFNVQWAARLVEAKGDLELCDGTLVLQTDVLNLK